MALNSFAPNTVIKSAEINDNWQNFSDHGRHFNLPWVFSGAAVVTDINKVYYSLPDPGTIDRVDLVIDTPPTGQDLIVDIERSTDEGATWITIFTNAANRPTISDGGRSGNTTTIDISATTALTHYYRAVLDQVGSTVAGLDLTVILRGKYDLD